MLGRQAHCLQCCKCPASREEHRTWSHLKAVCECYITNKQGSSRVLVKILTVAFMLISQSPEKFTQRHPKVPENFKN